MTDQTLPSGGGAYIRLADGTLQLEEAPTLLEAPVQAPVETPVEGAVERPAKRTLKEA